MLSQANLTTKRIHPIGQGNGAHEGKHKRIVQRIAQGDVADIAQGEKPHGLDRAKGGVGDIGCKLTGLSHTKTEDSQFERLLGKAAWQRLPAIVRQRFSKHITGDATALYIGEIVETRISMLGRVLAQLCRVIGAPLPLHSEAGQRAEVNVTEDKRHGGQRWTRSYEHEGGKPQTIASTKRFAGKTGLEEYLGYGIGMALRVDAEPHGITFTSHHYFIQLGSHQWKLPRWLAPGQTVVSHIDLGGGQFAFDLTLTHRMFGELVHQHGVFRDG